MKFVVTYLAVLVVVGVGNSADLGGSGAVNIVADIDAGRFLDSVIALVGGI
jgi:hypothetical protein